MSRRMASNASMSNKDWLDAPLSLGSSSGLARSLVFPEAIKSSDQILVCLIVVDVQIRGLSSICSD